MTGSSFKDDYDVASPQTLLLVGRLGNGKSATGNSILGKNRFESKCSSSGVTRTCKSEMVVLEEGQKLNVIDTPAGLFDSYVDNDFIRKENEISSCINMIGDGIHTFLVVLSVCSRFSKEEEATITNLHDFFGIRIYDYMILVFTWGDELDADDVTLENFLLDSPETLKETLCFCGNRCVLFDNKTKDESKRANQVQKLLSVVNLVSRNNSGNPFPITELKVQAEKFQPLKESNFDHQMHDEEFKRVVEMVDPKLKETTLSLERKVAEERATTAKVSEEAMAFQRKLDDTKRDLEMQIKEISVRKQEKFRKPSCMIFLSKLIEACTIL